MSTSSVFSLDNPIHVHFIGIGGISMSGIAELLCERGFKVSGSDNAESPLTRALSQKGADISIGQSADNINSSINLVVYTAAIRPDNPELSAACSAGIPTMTRAELLGLIMKSYKTPIAVSGTHGKTTTTSMISEMLLACDTDPTLSIGGILKEIGGNFRVGNSDLFVTEACEYTNSFLSFFPKISIILNVEADHLDFFKDIDDIRSSFHKFALLLPKDGALIINGEIPQLDAITASLPCQILTFGRGEHNDYYPGDITYDEFAHASFTLHRKNLPDLSVQLKVPGEHNILNAIAAIMVSDLLNLKAEDYLKALAEFRGTERRFEYKGKISGITIIDDYAHHPTEIEASLKAALKVPHREVWCIFQPHTYTRTKSFLAEFAQALSLADHVILAEIYAAREKDTLGISSLTLLDKIKENGTDCYYFPTFSEIEEFALKNCQEGDLLITMGAGNVVKIGEELLSQK